jgi:hypothetical protein
MVQQHEQTTKESRRLSENTTLSQNARSIVVDLLADELVVFTKRIHTAERKLHVPPGRWKTAPSTPMRTANDALDDDCVGADVLLGDFDFHVWNGIEELGIEEPNGFAPSVVFVPRFVVVVRSRSKRLHYGDKIMGVFVTNVIPNGAEPLAWGPTVNVFH